MTEDLKSEFKLASPIRALADLPPSLRDAPIDRPELLEHLGKVRYVTGKAAKVSHLTPAQLSIVRGQPDFKDFKGYMLKKNPEIVVPNNKIPLHKRERIPVDHLWGAYFEHDNFEMYDESSGLYEIVLYQRSNGSLSVGSERIKINLPRHDLTQGLTKVEAWSEHGFFLFMDDLTELMSAGELADESTEDKAEVLNILCEDALVMVNDGRMCLWSETISTFTDAMNNCWRAEWMIKAGITGSLNREGRRRNKARTNFIDGMKRPSKTPHKSDQKKRNGGGFG